jgi:hypothetical protein
MLAEKESCCMKTKLALTAALALVAVAPAASAAEVSHYMSSGAFASLEGFVDNGYSSLTVSQSGESQNETTTLQLYVSSCTYTSTSYLCSGTIAWGQIPNGDFAVHGNSGDADLSVNASSLSGSTYSYGCDWATWTCSFQNGPLSASGTISVTWDKTSEYSFSSDGTTEQNYLNYTFKTQGRQDSTSASVEGTILGTPISSANGRVGTMTSKMFSIVKNY